jgi:trigger factor
MSSLVIEDKEVSVKQTDKRGACVTLKITVEPSLVNKCFHNALLQAQAKAQIQGFRTGKVPLDLVRKNFERHILERTADTLIRHASGKALDKTKLKAVMIPSVTKADFATLKENKSFSFEVSVDVAPEFKVTGYSGIEIIKKSQTVTDKELDEHIRQILEHNANLETLGEGARVEDDSFVVVKYSGSKNGIEDKKYSSDSELVDMSAPQTIAGLAESVRGAKKGDVKTFDSKTDEGDITFSVTIEEIKKKVLPDLDDSFAKEMGFECVDKMKASVKEGMEKEAKFNSERDATRQIEDALVKANSFELPKSLVEYHTALALENFMQKMFDGKQNMPEENKKAFADRIRPSVERDLKIGYITQAIAESEKIFPTEADWQAELDKAVESQAKNKEDKGRITKFFNDRKDDIMATLSERKVFDSLKSKAKIR